MLRFIASLITVALAGFLQSATWFTVGGVKPDLTLVLVLIFFLIYRDWIERIAIVLVAELALKFTPTPDASSLIFLAATVAGGLTFDYLRLQPRLTLIIVTAASTVLLGVYGSLPWGIMLREVIYNLILAIIIYSSVKTPHGQKLYP